VRLNREYTQTYRKSLLYQPVLFHSVTYWPLSSLQTDVPNFPGETVRVGPTGRLHVNAGLRAGG
jgi:hypothetical protein